MRTWRYPVSWLLMCDRNWNASRKCSVALFVVRFHHIDEPDSGQSK